MSNTSSRKKTQIRKVETVADITMGNKQGKQRNSANGKGKGEQAPAAAVPPPPSEPVPPPPEQPKASPPPAPVAPPVMHPLLESKLSMVDVTTIFTPQDIDAIRSHLAALLGQREDEPIAIPKDEFYRFLGTSTSSLYVNRLYAIFDMSGKGTVRCYRSALETVARGGTDCGCGVRCRWISTTSFEGFRC
jgi:hypothetical protein